MEGLFKTISKLEKGGLNFGSFVQIRMITAFGALAPPGFRAESPRNS